MKQLGALAHDGLDDDPAIDLFFGELVRGFADRLYAHADRDIRVRRPAQHLHAAVESITAADDHVASPTPASA
ncbi:hypothetical protein [Streptomyces sp. NPDC091217]|uniref:hypothetical protein n=1 Tax=Streptomyces sp. NPDC091217 TaxID=3365975 RepID=UPI00380C7902